MSVENSNLDSMNQVKMKTGLIYWKGRVRILGFDEWCFWMIHLLPIGVSILNVPEEWELPLKIKM